jgi:membrane-bound lytic murein transglycosylase A
MVLAMPNTMSSRPTATLEPLAFSALAGWGDDDHAAALETFQRSCSAIVAEGNAFARKVMFGGKRGQWIAVCKRAATAIHAKRFFEENFQPLKVNDPDRAEGLFTGYYEPEAEGSRTPSDTYSVPLYGKPADLVALDAATEKRLGLRYGRISAGRPQPYFTRKEIEHGALTGRGLEIAWLRDWADAFFMQIQGSGRVRLSDGSLLRLAYAGKTGQPYTGIGGLLVARGAFTRDEMSMQATRAWMAKDEKAARELMWENKSFVFFREVDLGDPKLGPPGAQKVLLTPRRSLAVDRSLWMFGTPVWLDTMAPSGAKGQPVIFRHLMIAQDTGTAIKGYVRGDVFWGAGERAALTAGHMKSAGIMIVLLPKDLAGELTTQP